MSVGAGLSDRTGWLERLARVFDPDTFERLEALGVAPGSRVLDIGTGAGTVAAWLAERVGPEGRVVATDLDIGHAQVGEPNVELLEHDVLADDFPASSFDLIHCRAVLVHVGRPELALERMAGWLEPDGILLAQEPWTDVGLLSPDPVAARAAEALGRDVLDGSFARRLPQALAEVGLVDIEADARLPHFKGGSELAAFFKHTLAGATVELVGRGELTPGEVQRALAGFDDPGRSDWGWPRIAASGRRPG